MAEAMVTLPKSVINQLFKDIAEIRNLQVQMLGKDKEVWMSEEEACEWLGITKSTMQSYRCRGRIKQDTWRRVGRKIEYNRHAILTHSNT